MALSEPELERYARQLRLEGFDAEVQERLGGASAIVVGAGTLGTTAAAHLAAAGVARTGIVDPAPVAVADLRGGPLHFTPDAGRNKADSAVAKLGLLNTEVQSEAYPVALDAENAAAIVAGANVALDCSGSAATRGLVNDACCAEGVPLVLGTASGFDAVLLTVRPGVSACLRCAGPALEEVMGTPGAGLGAVAGVAGALQALEALKLLTGIGMPLLDRVCRLDARDLTTTFTAVERRPGCWACGGAGGPQQSR